MHARLRPRQHFCNTRLGSLFTNETTFVILRRAARTATRISACLHACIHVVQVFLHDHRRWRHAGDGPGAGGHSRPARPAGHPAAEARRRAAALRARVGTGPAVRRRHARPVHEQRAGCAGTAGWRRAKGARCALCLRVPLTCSISCGAQLLSALAKAGGSFQDVACVRLKGARASWHKVCCIVAL